MERTYVKQKDGYFNGEALRGAVTGQQTRGNNSISRE